jgi:hypothetical protein
MGWAVSIYDCYTLSRGHNNNNCPFQFRWFTIFSAILDIDGALHVWIFRSLGHLSYKDVYLQTFPNLLRNKLKI